MHPEPQIHTHLKQAIRPMGELVLPLLVIACTAFVFACYWPTLLSMVKVWRNSVTFSHGFVVLPVFVYLLWTERAALARQEVKPFAPALALVALSGLAWLAGRMAAVAAIQQLGMVAMVAFAVWSVLGTAIARQLAFPLLFLLFAVPVGHFLVPPLIDLTADFTVGALQLTGIPVYREGNYFQIPSGEWSVVQACSGIRYLLASLMGGVLFSHFFYHSWRKRLAFIALSLVVPVVANWVRAYLIVMLGHLTNNRLAVGVDHLIYGWIFFGVIIAIMFGIGARYADRGKPAGPTPAAGADKRSGFAAVLVGAVAAVALWRPAYELLGAPQAGEVALAPLPGTADWRPTAQVPSAFRPHYPNAAAASLQGFARDAASVGLFIGYYRDQERRGELIYHENGLLAPDDKNWRSSLSHAHALAVSAIGKPLQVRATRLRGAAGDLLVWQWYWIDGQVTASPYLAKLYLLRARMAGRGDDSAVLVAYTRWRQEDHGERTLGAFVGDLWPSVESSLRRAMGART